MFKCSFLTAIKSNGAVNVALTAAARKRGSSKSLQTTIDNDCYVSSGIRRSGIRRERMNLVDEKIGAVGLADEMRGCGPS